MAVGDTTPKQSTTSPIKDISKVVVSVDVRLRMEVVITRGRIVVQPMDVTLCSEIPSLLSFALSSDPKNTAPEDMAIVRENSKGVKFSSLMKIPGAPDMKMNITEKQDA